MEKILFQQTYPTMALRIPKNDIDLEGIDSMCRYFIGKIESDPFAKFIGIFDHYKHTASLADGEISDSIKAARVVLFCFGKKLLNPNVLSVRPRSIGLCETDSDYVISFMEAPNATMTQTMVQWAKQLNCKSNKPTK